jgi:hypothetical protein
MKGVKYMTKKQRWEKVCELASQLPNPHSNKESHMAHGKATAEIYFKWFPEAEYMTTNAGSYGSFLYIADENGIGVCSIYELGKQVFGE